MRAWESVQRSIQYMEGHLTDKIEMEELAAVAYLSPFYFQRLFNRLVGKTVMEYIKLRRLANAADYLIHNRESRIKDAAYRFGFENHETFTRAFKSVYGMTPESYRSNPRQLAHFHKPDLSMTYQIVDENMPLIADGITLEVSQNHLEAARIFCGLSIQHPVGDGQGVDLLGELWQQFHKLKPSLTSLEMDGREAGVSLPGKTDGCFTYFVGAEMLIQSAAGIVEPLEKWEMPSGRYIICSFEAENFHQLATSALMKARDYMFGVWLQSHGIATEPMMIELYAETTPEASSMEIWLKIKE